MDKCQYQNTLLEASLESRSFVSFMGIFPKIASGDCCPIFYWVKLQPILMSNVLPQCSEVGPINFGISGQKDDLVTRDGKVVMHERRTMIAIEPPKRRIDHNREGTT